MKKLISLILLLLMSCGTALPLSEQTVMVKEGIDTITDIENRFGDPVRFYKEHDRSKAYFVAKYENILESEVVYLRFVYINDLPVEKVKPRPKRHKDRFIFSKDLRDNFKQDWVLYEVDKRPNKHS